MRLRNREARTGQEGVSFRVPEEYRVSAGDCRRYRWPAEFGSDATFGNYGAFLLPAVVPGRCLKVIASEGQGWDHVSVSILAKKPRMPNWEEMCAVKDAFWDEEDVVMQLHPRRSQYVNYHQACLHLWRPNDGREIQTPPAVLVGPVDS